jgi:NAD(P)-dependent dehydrogenase (short-subunit alcohol dehydrogenase family)
MNGPHSILITGSASGFGRQASITLARRGHHVFASMREVDGRNAVVASELRSLAASEQLALQVIQLDVADDRSVATGVQTMVDQAGRIDVVVNNAAFNLLGITEATSEEQAQAIFNVNLLGMYRVNRAVVPYMRRQRSGLLIYISSSAGKIVYPFMGLYSASKAALEALAEAMHYELYSLGIDSTIIQACTYASSLAQHVQLAENAEVYVEYGEVGRLAQRFVEDFPLLLLPDNGGDPQEVAELIGELIDLPPGERPLRTPIGTFTGRLQFLNQSLSSVQSQVLPSLGLAGLLARGRLSFQRPPGDNHVASLYR